MFNLFKSTSQQEHSSTSTFETPRQQLELAILLNDMHKIKELLEKVDLQEKGQLGFTILHNTVRPDVPTEILEIVIQQFKQKKISLEIPDQSNYTALDWTFLEGNSLAAEILIKAGADYTRISPKLEEAYLDFFLKKKPEERQKFYNLLLDIESKQGTNKKLFSDPISGYFTPLKGYKELSTFEQKDKMDDTSEVKSYSHKKTE